MATATIDRPRRKGRRRGPRWETEPGLAESPCAVLEEIQWLSRSARTPRLRTMRQFAEQEIIIPDGEYRGRPFRCDRLPFNGLWFDAVDSGDWEICAATGPSQSSKTLCCYVIPTMYHLFEHAETVICGVPDKNMSADKWFKVIRPAIEASRYADQLTGRGAGSKGGEIDAIYFANGATLKFMSGGGSDKSRAGYTARVVVITEVDAMDQPGQTSREADKITQIMARTKAYDTRRRIYLECTTSIEGGRIWQEVTNGTNSRIALPCPKCRAWVTPEREHVTGWQDAKDELEARDKARWGCPECGARWTEKQRHTANHKAVLVHKGQEVDARGRVTGRVPRTKTLGFRWSAVNSLFTSTAMIGADLWRADRNPDDEVAERALCQFVFAVPWVPPITDLTPLSRDKLVRRTERLPRGLLPADTEQLTIGIDPHKRLGYWMLYAARASGAVHIPDYAAFEIHSDTVGVEKATLAALRDFREVVETGWPCADGSTRVPDQVWIDSGWEKQAEVIYRFCREAGARYRPTKGFGATQQAKVYRQPRKRTNDVMAIGENYHLVRLRPKRVVLVEINADAWKSWVHQRLVTPIEKNRPIPAGAMTFFAGMANEHRSLAHHLTAERKVEEWVPGKGRVIRWEAVGRTNHWFDCLYEAAAAAHFCGARLVAPEQALERMPATSAVGPAFTMPDGRPFLVTER